MHPAPMHSNFIYIPRVHPALPSPELLLICCYNFNLQIILELLEKAVLFKQPCPADLARAAQEVIADGYATHKLILDRQGQVKT